MRKEEEEVVGSESLSEDERRALRGSKFAPLPTLQPSRTQPRLAHPGGPLATNKAAALAKFLERKLQEPDGLTSINPALLEMAVKNAKETVKASGGTSNSGRIIRHVASFGDDSEDSGDSRGKNQDNASSHFGGCKKLEGPGNGKGKNPSKAKGTKGKTNKKKKKRKKVVTGVETTEVVKGRKKFKS